MRNPIATLVLLGLCFFSFSAFLIHVIWNRGLSRSIESVESGRKLKVVKKYTTYDKDSKKTNRGIISFPEGIVERDSPNFESVSISSYSHLGMISGFETDEYECSGMCYCYDDEQEEYEMKKGKRRTASKSSKYVSRSLIFLVAALSSTIATQKVKQRFQEECEEVCGPKYSSEVVECKDITSILLSESTSDSEEDNDGEKTPHQIRNEKLLARKKEIEKDERKKMIGTRAWSCKGQCFTNPKLKDPAHIQESKIFKCEENDHEGKVSSYNLDDLIFRLDYSLPFEELRASELENAMKIFQYHNLKRFCKEIGEFDGRKEVLFQDNGKVEWKYSEGLRHLCSSSTVDSPLDLENEVISGGDGKITNPSIQCVLTDIALEYETSIDNLTFLMDLGI